MYDINIEGLWSFAKERLIKHHGISKKVRLHQRNGDTTTEGKTYMENLSNSY